MHRGRGYHARRTSISLQVGRPLATLRGSTRDGRAKRTFGSAPGADQPSAAAYEQCALDQDAENRAVRPRRRDRRRRRRAGRDRPWQVRPLRERTAAAVGYVLGVPDRAGNRHRRSRAGRNRQSALRALLPDRARRQGHPAHGVSRRAVQGCVGVVWSRASIGNMRRGERPLTLVHSPVSAVAMPEYWGVWNRKFVTRADGDGWTATDVLAADRP